MVLAVAVCAALLQCFTTAELYCRRLRLRRGSKRYSSSSREFAHISRCGECVGIYTRRYIYVYISHPLKKASSRAGIASSDAGGCREMRVRRIVEA